MKLPNQWQWFVWGKHPGMSDFIIAGNLSPLFQRFTRWVDNGFSLIVSDDELKSRHCSWRFWTHGTADDIVCGLVRNSCDSFGRSFPLLYLGTGGLQGWTHNCSLLPFAFESVWKNFEYAGAARYHSVQRLNQSLESMQPPEPAWHAYRQRIFNQPNLYSTAGIEEDTDGRNRVFTIGCKLPENLPHDLNFCHQVMPQNAMEPIKAVFIGEIGSRIAVAIVDDILIPADFIWLWSLGRSRPQEGEGTR
jgi:type VI secretion system ImpM family protein